MGQAIIPPACFGDPRSPMTLHGFGSADRVSFARVWEGWIWRDGVAYGFRNQRTFHGMSAVMVTVRISLSVCVCGQFFG